MMSIALRTAAFAISNSWTPSTLPKDVRISIGEPVCATAGKLSVHVKVVEAFVIVRAINRSANQKGKRYAILILV